MTTPQHFLPLSTTRTIPPDATRPPQPALPVENHSVPRPLASLSLWAWYWAPWLYAGAPGSAADISIIAHDENGAVKTRRFKFPCAVRHFLCLRSLYLNRSRRR